MLEATYTLGAICAGASCAGAFIAIVGGSERIDAAAWLERSRNLPPPSSKKTPGPWSRALTVAGIHARLFDLIERAGWKESPERLSAFASGMSACLAVMGAAS